MMHKLRCFFQRQSLRTKLLSLFLLLGILPWILFSTLSFTISSNTLVDNACSHLQEMLKNNNEVISIQLERVEDAAMALIVDPVLQRELATVSDEKLTATQILHTNRALMQQLDQYFLHIPGIYAYHLLTDRFLMVGNYTNPSISSSTPAIYLPYDAFFSSSLYKKAVEANGKLVWIPTYSYEKEYNLSAYSALDYPYAYLFSAVKQINFLSSTTQDSWNPILIVSYLPSFLGEIVTSEFSQEQEMQILIATPDDDIVYISKDDDMRLTQKLSPELQQLVTGTQGAQIAKLNGKKSLIVYDTIPVNGWKQIIIAPLQMYIQDMVLLPNLIMFVSIALAVISSALVVYITGSWMKNLKALIEAMKGVGNGEFEIQIPVPADQELGVLARGFNDMEAKLYELIVDNYEMHLRTQEAQIAALNMQMNPHFLYNTLSTINWIAIDANQTEISEALHHLCQMLQTNFRLKGDFCTVEEDLARLEDYLYIMRLRYENQFDIQQEIAQDILPTAIPRSLFQPLVENSIVHGFQGMPRKGIITLSAQLLADGSRLLCVKDNGMGFDTTKPLSAHDDGTNHIGLSNLIHRLTILYKDRFDYKIESTIGTGTCITLHLPPDAPNGSTSHES